MKKADIEQFRPIIELAVSQGMDAVKKEMKPMNEMVLSHHQTLHGTRENPETGLVNEFGAIKRKVWKLTAVTNLVTGAVTAAVTYFTKGH